MTHPLYSRFGKLEEYLINTPRIEPSRQVFFIAHACILDTVEAEKVPSGFDLGKLLTSQTWESCSNVKGGRKELKNTTRNTQLRLGREASRVKDELQHTVRPEFKSELKTMHGSSQPQSYCSCSEMGGGDRPIPGSMRDCSWLFLLFGSLKGHHPAPKQSHTET